jgi:hypothetical protein
MRNAGDLDTAGSVYAKFHEEGRRFAKDLSLRVTQEAFALSKGRFEREYFDRFEEVCNELKSAEQA